MIPQFPIYVASKGRADSRITVRHLDAMGVDYRVIIERPEYDEYAAVIDPARLLVLPPEYQDRYDTFDELGDTKSKGPGPARNFAWDHAIGAGAEWHWILDDNIKGFYRLNHNLKVPVSDGTIFRCMEDFVLRYKNVAMAGPNYFMFASRKTQMAPFTANTRIYSCNLIRNDTPFRWRCRYNEDTDLSLRMLKAGWCTILFNAFLQYKLPTQTIKGGNTDAFYSTEGTLPKSRMLVRAHPDVTKLVWRFERWHHYVDYSRFKDNKLLRRADIAIPEGVNDYGMRLLHQRHEVEGEIRRG
jgi:TET-associated glycosyltransferase-like protein